MALVYTCTTELEAVNSMLEMIGEFGVSTLDDTEVSEASSAYKLLHRTSRKIQKEGLNCNTELEYELALDVSNHIVLPANTLDVTNVQYDNHVYIRNGKLYDAYENTYEFTAAITCDLVLFLEWTYLPEHVREYIMMDAARRFMSNRVGSESMLKQTDRDFTESRLTFKRHEARNSNANILTSPDTRDIVYRRAW